MDTASSKLSPNVTAILSAPTLPQTGFVRQAQLLMLIPFSKATLWRQVTAGTFPAPVKLTLRLSAWRVEDVRRWIEERRST